MADAPRAAALPSDDALAADRALWQSFQTAAGHVTNLYRESQRQQRRMFSRGASESLNELLEWTKSHRPHATPTRHSHSSPTGASGVLPAPAGLPQSQSLHSSQPATRRVHAPHRGHHASAQAPFASDANGVFTAFGTIVDAPSSPQLVAAGSQSTHAPVVTRVAGADYINVDALVLYVQALAKKYGAPVANGGDSADALVAGAVQSLSLGCTHATAADRANNAASQLPAAAAQDAFSADGSSGRKRSRESDSDVCDHEMGFVPCCCHCGKRWRAFETD